MKSMSVKSLTCLAYTCLLAVGCVITTGESDDGSGASSSDTDDDTGSTGGGQGGASAVEAAGAVNEGGSAEAGSSSVDGGAGADAGGADSVAGAATSAAGSAGVTATAGAAGAATSTAGAGGTVTSTAGAAGTVTSTAGAAGTVTSTAGAAGSGGSTTPTAGSGGSAGASGSDGTAGAAGSGNVATSSLAIVEDGTFIEGGRPNTTDSSTAPGVDAPSDVINGGTATYGITLESDAVAILVGIEGDTGYFTVPVTSTTGSQDVNITLLQGYSLPSLGVLIATQDAGGDVSGWTSITIPVTETLTGEVKISLTFDTDVDLDLHVYSPGDEHLYFGNKTLTNGGVLDLDSNAGCNIDGINNENVTWPEGTAPAGDYRIVVDYWNACSVVEDVNYIVTLTIGDTVTTYPGVVTADEADGSWESTAQEVTTFTYGG